jgi:hypothetical protein
LFSYINKILSGGKFLGTGGFGCVVSPAIVFPGSERLINDSNKQYYVTKISVDAQEEFTKCELIRMQLKRELGIEDPEIIGFFPEEIACIRKKEFEEMYLTNEETGLFTNKTELYSSFFNVNDVYVASNRRGILKDKVKKKFFNCQHILDKIRKSKNPSFCAIQIRRFDSDFTTFLDEEFYDLTADEKSFMQDDIFKKLNIMHNAKVYHCDIKEDNLAVYNGKIFFVDWGLAQLGYPNNYEPAKFLQHVLNPESDTFKYYFISLIEDVLHTHEREEVYEIVKNYYLNNQIAKAMRSFDIILLYCAVIGGPLSDQLHKQGLKRKSLVPEIKNYIEFYIEKNKRPTFYSFSEPRTPSTSESRKRSLERQTEYRKKILLETEAENKRLLRIENEEERIKTEQRKEAKRIKTELRRENELRISEVRKEYNREKSKLRKKETERRNTERRTELRREKDLRISELRKEYNREKSELRKKETERRNTERRNTKPRETKDRTKLRESKPRETKDRTKPPETKPRESMIRNSQIRPITQSRKSQNRE